MAFECDAQRLLNPFRGVINTIRHESAEAVTADGIHWDIYVSNESLQRDLAGRDCTQVSDIRYGRWSAANGLKRGPIFPSEDFRAMEAMGTGVFNHLHSRLLHDFSSWQAPWLLLFPTLNPGLRREYEQHACVQTVKVAEQYPLYPAIIDRAAIDSARIEARLRKTVPETTPDELSMSTFYLELDTE